MSGPELTRLELAVDEALECEQPDAALRRLWAELERAHMHGDQALLGAVSHLAQRIYDRAGWTVGAEAMRLVAIASAGIRRA